MPPSSEAAEGYNAEGEPTAMWQFVPVGEYEPPPPDVVESTKRRFSTWWRRLRPDIAEAVPQVKPEEELTRLPEWRLQRAAPLPEWSQAAAALDAALGDWVSDRSQDEPVRLLVTPPHIRRGVILTTWAERHGWRVLSLPSEEQILAGDGAWASEAFSDGGPWVLPNLEGLYLRHADGLDLICRFLDQAHAGKLGPGLIGCHSWAWAFLGHVWRGWLPPPLTLQAYDETRLAVCFRSLAERARGREVRFRLSDDGSDVLPSYTGEADGNDQSGFLHHLATYSRGNLGVAWAIWRTALSSEPLDDVSEGGGSEHPVTGQTIWVIPWSRVGRPSVPSGNVRDTAFVLHALLLHDGLSADLLRRLLPITANRITDTLDALRVAGLLAQDRGRWHVTAIGYPPVREFLQIGGYLTDDF